MYAEDKKIVATVRSNGIAVLPGLLAEDELTEIRHQFDQAYLDTDKGPGEPGTRDSISGTALLHYPTRPSPISSSTPVSSSSSPPFSTRPRGSGNSKPTATPPSTPASANTPTASPTKSPRPSPARPWPSS
jgi:hypothetical protein